MNKLLSFLSRFSVVIVLLVVSMPGYGAGIFLKGSTSISLIIGSGRAFNENYTVIGAGFNYYVADGLSLGLEAETWTGGTPSITKYSPQVQYVFQTTQAKPYLGAFFRRASIDGLEDLDSVGYRAGLYLNTRSNIYLSAGIVHEEYQDCNEAIFVSCSDTYPEVVLSFAIQ
jgi:hypothetical protein